MNWNYPSGVANLILISNSICWRFVSEFLRYIDKLGTILTSSTVEYQYDLVSVNARIKSSIASWKYCLFDLNEIFFLQILLFAPRITWTGRYGRGLYTVRRRAPNSKFWRRYARFNEFATLYKNIGAYASQKYSFSKFWCLLLYLDGLEGTVMLIEMPRFQYIL